MRSALISGRSECATVAAVAWDALCAAGSTPARALTLWTVFQKRQGVLYPERLGHRLKGRHVDALDGMEKRVSRIVHYYLRGELDQ